MVRYLNESQCFLLCIRKDIRGAENFDMTNQANVISFGQRFCLLVLISFIFSIFSDLKRFHFFKEFEGWRSGVTPWIPFLNKFGLYTCYYTLVSTYGCIRDMHTIIISRMTSRCNAEMGRENSIKANNWTLSFDLPKPISICF